MIRAAPQDELSILEAVLVAFFADFLDAMLASGSALWAFGSALPPGGPFLHCTLVVVL